MFFLSFLAGGLKTLKFNFFGNKYSILFCPQCVKLKRPHTHFEHIFNRSLFYVKLKESVLIHKSYSFLIYYVFPRGFGINSESDQNVLVSHHIKETSMICKLYLLIPLHIHLVHSAGVFPKNTEAFKPVISDARTFEQQ